MGFEADKIIISAHIRTQTQLCKSKNKYKKITLLNNRRATQVKNKRQLRSPLRLSALQRELEITRRKVMQIKMEIRPILTTRKVSREITVVRDRTEADVNQSARTTH